ncbi:MAG TPA: putative DNA binding domain-containing protein, partial [bacterium]|nr:putative DNA binding domain-containing protein [bacterium]
MNSYIAKIIEKGEGRRVEFKSMLPEGNQIAQTVIAFSNSVGGEIFIGIDDKTREVGGVTDSEIFKLEEIISQIIFDNCSPLMIPDITIYSHENKNILCIKVYPSKNGPYFLKSKGKNKGTYVRVGSTNRVADEAILAELERRRRNVSFDSMPVYDLSAKDCDLVMFKGFYHEKSGKQVGTEQLQTLELVKSERNEEFITNAAILLSSNQIKKSVFPYAKIECARFKGKTTEVMIDQQTIESPVFNQPEEAMKFIMRNISQSSTIGLVYRKDRWEYPLKAIREVVINAVIHRDYSIMGSDIKIAIFDDMLEITSPGTLMPSVDPEVLENTSSEIRNRVLAPIFKDCKLIEQWGSGFNKIYAELIEYPDVLLKINEPGMSFQMQFIKNEYVEELSDGGLNEGLNEGL